MSLDKEIAIMDKEIQLNAVKNNILDVKKSRLKIRQSIEALDAKEEQNANKLAELELELEELKGS